jgi:uncharacterized protein YjbJ (UPF0337 family)
MVIKIDTAPAAREMVAIKRSRIPPRACLSGSALLSSFRSCRSDCRSCMMTLANWPCSQREARLMDKDRIAGSAKEIKGSVKQTIGRAIGDAKLESDGKTEKAVGKVQNAIGGLKDALRK